MIASSYKERLSRITNGVFDSDDELEIPPSSGGATGDSPASVRRFSHRSVRLASPVVASPIANGTGAEAALYEEVRALDRFVNSSFENEVNVLVVNLDV